MPSILYSNARAPVAQFVRDLTGDPSSNPGWILTFVTMLSCATPHLLHVFSKQYFLKQNREGSVARCSLLTAV